MDRCQDQPASPRPRGLRTGTWLLLILTLSLGIYAPTLINGYTYDDPHYARTILPTGDANPMVATMQPVHTYWTRPMNWGIPTNCRGYRPLTVWSYAAVNTVWPPRDSDGEDNAWAQHAINLFLHGLATLLVFFLAQPLLGRTPALGATLVFGVHSLHSGAIAAIVGRGELLAFVFGAGAALAWLRCLNHSDRRALALTPVLLWLSFSAKESALAWLGFLPLLGWASHVPWRRQLRMGALLAVPALAYGIAREATLIEHVYPRGEFSVAYDANPLFALPFLDRFMSASCILVFGLGKLLVPSDLACNYGDGPFPIITEVWDWRFLVASLVLCGLGVLAALARHNHRSVTLVILGFFGFTFITSNLVVPIETNFAERTYYAAVLSVALGLGLCLRHAAAGYQLRLVVGALCLWVLGTAAVGWERGFAWRDNATLFTTDLEHRGDSVGLHIDVGDLHRRRGRTNAARREYEAALALHGDSPRALAALATVSDESQALDLLNRALASPHLVAGSEGRHVHWSLGQLHARAGRPVAARRNYERALACAPHLPGIRIHLLRDAAGRKDLATMAQLLAEGRKWQPDFAPFEVFAGIRLALLGQDAEACRVLAKALPGMPMRSFVADGWMALAAAAMRSGDGTRAREIARRFVRQKARFPHLAAQCEAILRTAPPTPSGR